ncbi:tetratricopeptide repeat protein 18 [Striga asiatica]|uniref:Tetratricopeptide repeat protein 18 n=1 Tax=Striga asiatica TaxID=4170 RepID=A0A5A7QP61_STRAF|nr:tetratricopeptide repeat protein 18 [Striga asiatica]
MVWRPHPFSGDWRSISTAVDPSRPHPFPTAVSSGDNNRRISRRTTAVERGGTVEVCFTHDSNDYPRGGDKLDDDTHMPLKLFKFTKIRPYHKSENQSTVLGQAIVEELTLGPPEYLTLFGDHLSDIRRLHHRIL